MRLRLFQNTDARLFEKPTQDCPGTCYGASTKRKRGIQQMKTNRDSRYDLVRTLANVKSCALAN